MKTCSDPATRKFTVSLRQAAPTAQSGKSRAGNHRHSRAWHPAAAGLALWMILSVAPVGAEVFSIDIGHGAPRSGQPEGIPFAQTGSWNQAPLNGGGGTNTITVNNLKDGDGADTTAAFILNDNGASYAYFMSASGATMSADMGQNLGTTGVMNWKITGLVPNSGYEVWGTGWESALFAGAAVGSPGQPPGTRHAFGTVFTMTTDGSGTLSGCWGDNVNFNYEHFDAMQIRKLDNQPLTANAGADQAVSPASPTAVIGGNPSASGGTGPYVYTWSPATGLSDATVANPTANPTTTTEYTLTVTDSASPTPAEASDTVTVTYSEPPLVANAGADKDLSPSMPSAQIGGSPAALDGTPPYTYSWSPATGLSDPTVANPTASPTTTTEYTLTVTDSASPTPAQVSDTVTVTYTVPPLVANAGADKTVGEGSPPVVIGGSPAASGGTPPYTYGWTSDPAGFTSAEPNPAVLPTVTTVYTLTVTDSASATASDTVTITFTVTPSTVFASEDFESYPVATNASSVSLGWYNWVFGTDDGEGNIVGKLNGGLGWAEGWSNGGLGSQNGTPGVTSTSPNFIISEDGPSGKFYDGANASSDNSGYGKSRRFASTIGDSWQSSALSFGTSGATVGFSSTSGYWSFNITSNGGNYGLAEYGGGAQTVNLVKAVSTDPASPDRVVTKIAGSLVSLWINPVNTSSEAALGTPDVTITVGHPNLTAYTMTGKVRVDNILVGSTLAAVMPSSGSPYDAWAALHAGNQSASEDFDLDGVPNGVEFFMGSPAGMTSAPGVLDGKVTWPRVGVVASFDVQVSNDLVTWTTADPADVDTSDPSEVVYTLPPGADKSFCRLMVIP